MKGIRFACLEQTIHLGRGGSPGHGAATAVNDKVENDKLGLEEQQTRNRADGKNRMPNGSIQLDIRRRDQSKVCGGCLE